MKETMDCKEFERLIPGFIEEELEFSTLKRFLDHMEQCGGCKEELEIQFLVTEGVQRLEDGRAFDLQRELTRRLAEARQKIRVGTNMIRLGITMEIAAAFILAGVLISVLV